MATHKRHKHKPQQQPRQQQMKKQHEETAKRPECSVKPIFKSMVADSQPAVPKTVDKEPLIGVFSAALRRRAIRVAFRQTDTDDVLWLAIFALTMLLLDVPRVLLFNQRIQRLYLAGAGACALICCAMAFYLRVLAQLSERFAVRNLLFIRLLFIGCLLGAGGMFCAAAWPVYHIWAAYITVVSMFTFLAVIAVI